jgi:restriction system protein
MFVRALGISLLILVSIPFVVAVPPLAAVPLLFLFFGTRGKKAKASGRGRSAGAKGGRPPRKSQPAKATRSAPARRRARPSNGGNGWVPLLLLGGLLLVALARENPEAAAAIVIVVFTFVVVAVWLRRRWSRPKLRAPAYPHRIKNVTALSTVDAGTQFELYVIDLLHALGFRDVWHLGGTGDNGVDIVAEDKQGRTFLVQCKRFTTGKVGSVDIQKLLGAVAHQDAFGGIFVTTSGYTPAAVTLAQSGRIPITLLDGNDVARLSRRAS